MYAIETDEGEIRASNPELADALAELLASRGPAEEDDLMAALSFSYDLPEPRSEGTFAA